MQTITRLARAQDLYDINHFIDEMKSEFESLWKCFSDKPVDYSKFQVPGLNTINPEEIDFNSETIFITRYKNKRKIIALGSLNSQKEIKLSVSYENRRYGIGTILYTQIENHAKEEGLDKINFSHREVDLQAKYFILSLGAECISRTNDHFFYERKID